MTSPSIRLVVADLALLDAAQKSDEALSRALGGAEVSEGWSVFPEALPATRAALASDPDAARWGTRFFVVDDPPALAGWGGFKGEPVEGVVELGYEIAPPFRNRGLASAAVAAMLVEAYATSAVTAVLAHTLPERSASTRVLEKTGFAHIGSVPDEDVGTTWRWCHQRN